MSAVDANSKYASIKEGLAYILVPKDAQLFVDPQHKNASDAQPQSVFYNPIQQFNRDLSVLAIRAYGEDLIGTKTAKAERLGASKRKKQKKPRSEKATVEEEGLIADEAGTQVDEAYSVNEQKRTSEDAGLPNLDDTQPTKRPKFSERENIEVDTETVIVTPLIESNRGDQTAETRPDDGLNSINRHSEIKQASKIKFKILDALSATGLRALRYCHELPFVTEATANDLSSDATKSIQENVKYNNLEGKIKVVTGNALAHMYSLVNLHSARGPNDNHHKYDVVDLDPYGTAAPFLDASIQAINDGGLLCVTCTDAAIFASVGYCEKTFAQYGGMPIKGLHSHEGGLRLILHSIATTAARYGMSIEPLLSLSIDFYARVFVRVFRAPAEVKFLAGKTMMVYSCDSGCGAWQTQYLGRYQSKLAKNGTPIYAHGLAQGPTCSTYCEHCGFKTHVSGPMYGGPLHNPAFIETILSYLPDLDKETYATTARIEGMLSTALEETIIQGDPEAAAKKQTSVTTTQSNSEDPIVEETVPASTTPSRRLVPRMDPAEQDRHPFFWFPSALSKVLHSQAPSEAAIKGALRHAGYRATRSHAKPGAIRTDAPWAFIWEMMREWVRQKSPIKEDSIKPGQAGWKIMEKVREAKSLRTVQEEVESVVKEGEDAGQVQPTNATNERVASESEGKWKIVFDEQLGREGGKKRLVRYQTNPRANWGPMVRAKK